MEERRYELGMLTIELTRRCNMRCDHCMRGEPECADMEPKVMDALFKKLRGVAIGQIILGGGESTCAPDRLKMLADRMEKHHVYPGMFCMTTNGKSMPRGFAKTLGRINRHCEVYVSRSADEEHERISQDALEEIQELLRRESRDGFGSPVRMEDRNVSRGNYYDRNSVLMMGHGAKTYYGHKADWVEPYDCAGVTDSDNPPMFEDMFYVDVHGYVWPSCDLSYEFMRRRKKYCLGNVTDPGFDWYRAAIEFNMRHGRSFPLPLVEPGFDGRHEPLSHIHKYVIESSEKKIKATNALVKKMKDVA